MNQEYMGRGQFMYISSIVMSFLPLSDVLSMTSVCKDLRELLYQYEDPIRPQRFHVLARYFYGRLYNLDLSGYRDKVHMSHLYKNCKILNLSGTRISSVNYLGKVRVLDISCTEVKDVSNLRNVRELNINRTPIRNFCYLPKLHTLKASHTRLVDTYGMHNIEYVYLNENHYLTDLSGLGNNKVVDLSMCPNISNVDSLKNVLDVDLSYCHRVEDVSCLTGVSFLNCSYTNVKYVKDLGNLQYLSAGGLKLNSVNCKNLFYLDLSNNQDLYSIKQFEGVENLTVNRCLNIVDWELPKSVSVLRAKACSQIEDVDLIHFKGLYSLDLSETNITNIEHLVYIRFLRLSRCYMLIDLKPLENVYSLDISHTSIMNLEGAENVKAVDISYTQVKDVFPLRNAEYVNMCGCVYIVDIRPLIGVEKIVISHAFPIYGSQTMKNIKYVL